MRAADWTGAIGESWAREWRRTDRTFAGLAPHLERAILARASSGPIRVVDIGCGAGTTSLAIAAALPEALLVGVDLSADLVAVAEERRARDGLAPARCRFVAEDAIALATDAAPVDLFVSRHGVMFFDDPPVAFARLTAAAAPRAAMVFSCFTRLADNGWAFEPLGLAAPPPADGAAPPEPGPFAFADPARVSAMLAGAGWEAAAPERVSFRYVAGAGDDPVADAVSFFRRIGPVAAALREADEARRPALLDRVAAACERRLVGKEVAFPAAAWLWSATAREPSA